MELRPRVAITMGDAAGIGPEIIVKSFADASVAARAIPLVLGEARVLERAMDATGVRLPIRTIAKPAEAAGRPGTIELIDYRNVDVTEHRWGEVNPAFGDAAVHYTREAGRLALAGEIDAMVSAPLNKEAMHAAGHRYEGQTEILGELTGTRPAMLLLLGKMRLMLFTNHMALRAVCDYVRRDRVLDRLALAAAALRDLGIARPRLAVAGLNPHAGEEGAFGHEERDEIVPAIAAARPSRGSPPRTGGRCDAGRRHRALLPPHLGPRPGLGGGRQHLGTHRRHGHVPHNAERCRAARHGARRPGDDRPRRADAG